MSQQVVILAKRALLGELGKTVSLFGLTPERDKLAAAVVQLRTYRKQRAAEPTVAVEG